ncbi:MAG: type II secretion system protein [Planctomycetaceae bacterium]|nr:type II secretion system protein [Planctomycetaceae bacterium]
MAVGLKRSAQRGLSLIEMLVVLGVIVAVAGMVIVSTGDSGERARSGTIIGSLNGLKSALNNYAASNNKEPESFDSLTDSAGALFWGLTPLLTTATPEAQARDFDGADTAVNGEASLLQALVDAGVTKVVQMNTSGTGDATWNSSNGTTLDIATAISGGTVVDLAELTDSGETKLGLTSGPNEVYVIVGVGKTATLVKNGIDEAPTCQPPSGTPETMYSRFLVVYQVMSGGVALKRAKRVDVVSSDFKTQEQHEQDWHSTN